MIPPYLKKGDTIAIVSTARKITEQELQPAINEITSRGYKIVLGDTIGLEDNQYAGTDTQRAADFTKQLNNSKIKAILCARGGYGTVRIVDKIDFSNFITHPKWIIGYSDVTALHTHIHNNFDICTLHATMPVNFKANTPQAINSLFTAIEGNHLEYTCKTNPANRKGTAKGQLIGGNLSVIYSTLGSISDIDTTGKILFIEDLDEYIYHIDRMMLNLKRGDKLANLAGLVVGGMSDMNDNAIPFGKTATEIIMEAVAEYNYPVCFDFPAGHIDDNRALIMGAEAELKIEESVLLSFLK
jgi:muramoyltetrapeptide carboxypeptidase